jgi:hypothetical protein
LLQALELKQSTTQSQLAMPGGNDEEEPGLDPEPNVFVGNHIHPHYAWLG